MGLFRRRRRRRRRRRGGFFGRISRSLRRVFRRRRRRAAPPRKKTVTPVRRKEEKPHNIDLGTSSKLTSKEKEVLSQNKLMFMDTVPGNNGNLLVDTSLDSRIGKWLPGDYKVIVRREDAEHRYGEATFKLSEEGQAVMHHEPSETIVTTLLDGAIVDTKDIEPPASLPDSPKMPEPPLPRYNQPDNTAAPVGRRRGSWKTIVPKVKKSEWPLFPPNRKFEYNKKHIFRIIPVEKAPPYLWIKRFLGEIDYYEGFGNDIEITTPTPPLGIERGDHIFMAEVDKVDTIWKSYEGVAKYFISRKPTTGYVLLTDLKVNDITDIPLIREDFERNMPGLPKGYTGGKAGEVELDLYDSVNDVAFVERGDTGKGGEVPVSPNVVKWALPTTYNHPSLFNLGSEEYLGAESLGLSGTAGSEDEWDYLLGTAKDVKERKQFKRFRKRHPRRIFRRILKQQSSTIRRIELRNGKLRPSVRRNIKKSLVRKRMVRRMSALEQRRTARLGRKRNIPLWKRGGRTVYGFSKQGRRGKRNPFFRQRRQRRGSIIN